METYTPEQLLSLWRREEPAPETLTGHILQNLVRIQRALNAHNLSHYTLKGEVDQLRGEVERLKKEVSRLQADLNQLQADFETFKKTQTDPASKGKKEPPPKRKSDDE